MQFCASHEQKHEIERKKKMFIIHHVILDNLIANPQDDQVDPSKTSFLTQKAFGNSIGLDCQSAWKLLGLV